MREADSVETNVGLPDFMGRMIAFHDCQSLNIAHIPVFRDCGDFFSKRDMGSH